MITHIDYETQKAYKEVNQILDMMGQKYKNKINRNLLKALKEKEAKDYQTKINPNLSFLEQKISRKALSILAVLNVKYWSEDEYEKERLINLYYENSKKYNMKYKEIFNQQKNIKNEGEIDEPISLELVPVKKSFLAKIRVFLRNLFGKIKK